MSETPGKLPRGWYTLSFLKASIATCRAFMRGR